MQDRNVIWGMNSIVTLIALPKNLLFQNETKRPNIMWMTPIMIEIFILNELRNTILLVEICQTGSTPKG